jgi:octaprenyl-diphosphate synthase
MTFQDSPMLKIKSLAQDDLMDMDLVIKNKLLQRAPLVRDITYHIINSGGKRLRPILSILSAKLFGYSGKRHVNLSAAIEFIHTATLLHDDVVDHSNLRRGLPTANKNWDNKSSILVGDFLFSQAFILMAEDNDLDILEILSKASATIAEGEVKQLSSISNLSLNMDEYIKIISAKTAELFAAACQVGTAVATKDEQLRVAMYNFGLNLGIAFQIMDDVLDYMATRTTLGKEIGDDFNEGKVTLPVILAYTKSNSEEKDFWLRTITKLEQNTQDFETALGIINKYEIIEECLDIAKNYTIKAKEHIAIAPENQIKSSLLEVLDFAIKREF